MSLPSFLFKKEKSNQYYFGLFVKEDEGVGLVIEGINSHFRIIAKESFTFSNGWENITDDVDRIVSTLEQRTQKKLDDLILFVTSSLVDKKTKELKQIYLEKIRSLTKDLGFKPLGFIECYEAILYHLDKKEKLPLTAILIELSKISISIFVYKGGQLVFSKTVAKTENIIDDLEAAFEERKDSILLPSRIILYDSSNLEEESSKILTHRWREEIFIQPPKVEIIKQDELLNGMVKVFGQEIGAKEETIEPGRKEEDTVMGFVIGRDIEEKEKKPPSQIKSEQENQKTTSFSIASFLSKIFSPLFKIKFGLKTNNLLLVIVGSFLILSSVAATEYFFHKAQLKILFPYQEIKKEMTIKTAQRPDSSNRLLIKSTTNSIEVKEEKKATGKQTVGEKAQGKVILHNFSDQPKIFPKGTVLEANNIQFILDSQVKVASASEAVINGGLVKQPGKSEGKITAVEIGPEGNLGQQTRFKIDQLPQSTYFAINKEPLKGGSKEEITTVSKTDLQTLKQRVLEKTKSKEKISQISQLPANSKLVNDLTETKIKKEQYSKELGEEAKTVTLKAVIETTYYYYNDNYLKKLLQQKIKPEIKSGYQLPTDDLRYQLKKGEKTKDGYLLKIRVNAKAIKQVNKEKIKERIILKNQDQINTILKEEFGAVGYQLNISQILPVFKKRLPFFKKNITITITNKL